MSLRQLQQSFSEALYYRHSTVAEQIAHGRFPAEQLLQIYRNNFIISLSEVLEATYPCVKAMVGEECFQQLARQYVLTHALQQSDVSTYGEGLDNTIEAINDLHQPLPYLADLARLEWQVDCASRQAEVAPQFPFEKLQGIKEDVFANLQLTVPESTYYLDSDYAIVTLWQHITQDEFEDMDINRPESAIVQRRPDQLLVMPVNRPATALVQLSQQRKCLGEADEDMLGMLQPLVQAQIFSDLNILEEESS